MCICSSYGRFPIKHGHSLIKHGHFPTKHGHFPTKQRHSPTKHGHFPIRPGHFSIPLPHRAQRDRDAADGCALHRGRGGSLAVPRRRLSWSKVMPNPIYYYTTLCHCATRPLGHDATRKLWHFGTMKLDTMLLIYYTTTLPRKVDA